MQRDLTQAERHFIDVIAAKLPPIIARDALDRVLGGAISPYTVKRYDLEGRGPAGTYRVGRRVTYLTQSLLTWMVLEYGVKHLGNLEELLDTGPQRRGASRQESSGRSA